MQTHWLPSLLLSLLLLSALLGVQGRNRKNQGDEEEKGYTTEGDVIITTTRNESHASSTAYASAGGASATANAETTFNTIRSVNGESDEESEDEESEKSNKKSKKNHRSGGEANTVTKRVRDAILNGDVDRVASLLGRLNDTDSLGKGFTFPARRREDNLIFTENRTTDPDVVALKGMAKAALEGDVSEKLTEVFIAAVYGLDFYDSVCFKRPEFTHSTHSRVETRNKTVVKSGFRKITNESGTFTIENDPQVRNSVSQDTLFEETSVEFEKPEMPHAEDFEEEEVCYTEKEIKTIRRNLRQDFRDVDLMTAIVEGIPREISKRQRSLLNVETPTDTWLCSACWKKKFCNKNAYWCPW